MSDTVRQAPSVPLDQDYGEWARLYRMGWSSRRVAAAVGVSSPTVLARLREMGVSIRDRSFKLSHGFVTSHGYYRLRKSYVHRIVCRAWHGPPPTPDHEVNHIDGDKLNNHPDNLEWVTHRENLQHAWSTGLTPPPPRPLGEEHHSAKLTRESVLELRRLWRAGWTSPQLAARYGISQRSAYSAATGRTWKHVEPEASEGPASHMHRVECGGCGAEMKPGGAPVSTAICPRCEEAYDLELANEGGPASGDGGQAVDPTTPGHEGGDALRPEGNEAEVSA